MRFLWLLFHIVVWTVDGGVSAGSEEDLRELLATETSLIDALRKYTEALEQQLMAIRGETSAIEETHRLVGENVEEHMENPLNVLTILKRFQSAWPLIEQLANDTQSLAENQPDYQMELQLPSEEDYETALVNLLRLQSVYNLEPASLSWALSMDSSWGKIFSTIAN